MAFVVLGFSSRWVRRLCNFGIISCTSELSELGLLALGAILTLIQVKPGSLTSHKATVLISKMLIVSNLVQKGSTLQSPTFLQGQYHKFELQDQNSIPEFRVTLESNYRDILIGPQATIRIR
jgi:hypothetical protein